MDLAAEVEPVYGAPPLLNEKVVDGELDAVLNYWHFAARLEGKGYQQLVGVEEAIGELGVASVPPQLGYVFYRVVRRCQPDLIVAFADASRAAKELLQGDAEWERIRPLTKAEDDATFEALKRRFREGIIERWGEAEQADAAELYAILAELGGEELVGGATELAPGTFVRLDLLSPAVASTGEARTFERQAAAAPIGLAARLRPALIPAASIAGLVLLWYLGALIADDPRGLPTPGAVLHAVSSTRERRSALSPERDVAARGRELVIAMAIGTAIGIAMGRAPLFDRIAHPWLVFFLNIPALVTIVLAYIWIGLVESALIFAVAINRSRCRGHRARGCPGARSRPVGDGHGVPGRLVADPAAGRVAAALSVSRRGRPLRARSDLEDRAGDRAARPLERGRLSGSGCYFQLFDVTGILAYALAFVAVIQLIEWTVLLPLGAMSAAGAAEPAARQGPAQALPGGRRRAGQAGDRDLTLEVPQNGFVALLARSAAARPRCSTWSRGSIPISRAR